MKCYLKNTIVANIIKTVRREKSNNILENYVKSLIKKHILFYHFEKCTINVACVKVSFLCISLIVIH